MTKFICDKCETQFEGNYCPECGDKKTSKDEEIKTDKEIIKEVFTECKQSISKLRINPSLVFYVLAIIYFFIGMKYKVEEELMCSMYFVGYMVLTVGFLISGILLKKGKN